MGSRGPIGNPRGDRAARRRRAALRFEETTRKRRATQASKIRIPARVKAIPAAAAAWKRLAPGLVEAGRLTTNGVEAFARLCTMSAEIEELERIIATEGWTIFTKAGTAAHPAARLLLPLRRDWVALARDFGMTAVSAARIPDLGGSNGEGEEGDSEEAQLRAFTGSA